MRQQLKALPTAAALGSAQGDAGFQNCVSRHGGDGLTAGLK